MKRKKSCRSPRSRRQSIAHAIDSTAFAFIVIVVIGLLIATAPGRLSAAGENASVSANDPQLNRSRPTSPPSSEELFRKISPAVVKLTLRQFGVPISNASGFFVGPHGKLITHRKLLSTAYANPDSTLELITSDGKLIKDIHVLACGDLITALGRGELCSLKVRFEPKSYFNNFDWSGTDVETAAIFAHPDGQDLAVTHAKLLHLKQDLELDSTVSAHQVGGPVVDELGHLLGVVAPSATERQVRLKLILASEVKPFIMVSDETNSRTAGLSGGLSGGLSSGLSGGLSGGLAVSEARQAFHEQMNAELKLSPGDAFNQALDSLIQGKALGEGFKSVSLGFDTQPVAISLPQIFDDCGAKELTRNSTRFKCLALNGTVVLSVKRMPAVANDLMAFNQKRILESEPIEAVALLKDRDEWELYEPLLSAKQIGSFNAKVGPANCQNLRQNKQPQALLSEQPACRYLVRDDLELGSHAIYVDSLLGTHLYRFELWLADQALEPFFSSLLSVAVLSARKADREMQVTNRHPADDPAANRPESGLILPEPLEFIRRISQQNSRASIVYDQYGKKLLLDRFEDDFRLLVTRKNLPSQPSDYSRETHTALTNAAAILKAKTLKTTLESDSITLKRRPAQIITVFAKDENGHDIFILHANIFLKNSTLSLTQSSATRNPGDSYKEFRDLLSRLDF